MISWCLWLKIRLRLKPFRTQKYANRFLLLFIFIGQYVLVRIKSDALRQFGTQDTTMLEPFSKYLGDSFASFFIIIFKNIYYVRPSMRASCQSLEFLMPHQCSMVPQMGLPSVHKKTSFSRLRHQHIQRYCRTNIQCQPVISIKE